MRAAGRGAWPRGCSRARPRAEGGGGMDQVRRMIRHAQKGSDSDDDSDGPRRRGGTGNARRGWQGCAGEPRQLLYEFGPSALRARDHLVLAQAHAQKQIMNKKALHASLHVSCSHVCVISSNEGGLCDIRKRERGAYSPVYTGASSSGCMFSKHSSGVLTSSLRLLFDQTTSTLFSSLPHGRRRQRTLSSESFRRTRSAC